MGSVWLCWHKLVNSSANDRCRFIRNTRQSIEIGEHLPRDTIERFQLVRCDVEDLFVYRQPLRRELPATLALIGGRGFEIRITARTQVFYDLLAAALSSLMASQTRFAAMRCSMFNMEMMRHSVMPRLNCSR